MGALILFAYIFLMSVFFNYFKVLILSAPLVFQGRITRLISFFFALLRIGQLIVWTVQFFCVF